MANKNPFFNNYNVDIFLFVTVIILLVVTTMVMYILCKHMKLKSLVTSLALQQIKEVGVVTKQEHVSIAQDIKCTWKIQWYMIIMLNLSILGILIFLIINARKIKTVFRGHLFSDTVKIMLFISDVQYYVPVKLCRTTGSIHLFKIMEINSWKCFNKKTYTLGHYRIRLERSEMTLNRNKINLPASVIKLLARCECLMLDHWS